MINIDPYLEQWNSRFQLLFNIISNVILTVQTLKFVGLIEK